MEGGGLRENEDDERLWSTSAFLGSLPLMGVISWGRSSLLTARHAMHSARDIAFRGHAVRELHKFEGQAISSIGIMDMNVKE